MFPAVFLFFFILHFAYALASCSEYEKHTAQRYIATAAGVVLIKRSILNIGSGAQFDTSDRPKQDKRISPPPVICRPLRLPESLVQRLHGAKAEGSAAVLNG